MWQGQLHEVPKLLPGGDGDVDGDGGHYGDGDGADIVMAFEKGGSYLSRSPLGCLARKAWHWACTCTRAPGGRPFLFSLEEGYRLYYSELTAGETQHFECG